jgi:hypothetical protein
MKDGSSTEEQWKFFTFSWHQYKTLINITWKEKESLGDSVASLVYSRLGYVKYKALTEVELMKEARQLVVKSRSHHGRFHVEFTACQWQADYTDQMVHDNLIRGLADEEIKRKVLATPETDCTLAKVMRFVGQRRAPSIASPTASCSTPCLACPASRGSRGGWSRVM